MTTTVRKFEVQRTSIVSSQAFHDVVARLEATVAHPEVPMLGAALRAAKSEEELSVTIEAAVGDAGLMEFARFDLGEVLRKRSGAKPRRSIRFLIGNPWIMSQMTIHISDAGSYAPVTVLVDELAAGVTLTYDAMESFLLPYANDDALKVARDLHAKVLKLFELPAN